MPSADADSRAESRAKFAGTWTLVEQISRRGDGSTYYPRGKDAIGVVVYDAISGYMSVQLGSSEVSAVSLTDYATAMHGFIAYHGPYEVDEVAQIVVHHVHGCTYPGWASTDQVRHFEFANDGDLLTLSADGRAVDGTPETRILTWKRLPAAK